MDNDTRQDLRRKKLCFTCQEPWIPGHRCSGKGKAYYIEAYSDSEEDEDYQDQEQGETTETVAEGQALGGTIATMTGVPRFHTPNQRYRTKPQSGSADRWWGIP